MVLPLPQGNHVAKFGKDPKYRTKVIVQKPVWTPARHTQSHNTAPSRDGRIIHQRRPSLIFKHTKNISKAAIFNIKTK